MIYYVHVAEQLDSVVTINVWSFQLVHVNLTVTKLACFCVQCIIMLFYYYCL